MLVGNNNNLSYRFSACCDLSGCAINYTGLLFSHLCYHLSAYYALRVYYDLTSQSLLCSTSPVVLRRAMPCGSTMTSPLGLYYVLTSPVVSGSTMLSPLLSSLGLLCPEGLLSSPVSVSTMLYLSYRPLACYALWVYYELISQSLLCSHLSCRLSVYYALSVAASSVTELTRCSSHYKHSKSRYRRRHGA